MRLGIDFDNTIVCYDAVFHRVGVERGLIPAELPMGKSTIRDHLRQIGREDDWTEMQGYVYGARMAEADPFPGVVPVLCRCTLARVPVFIISHKTRHALRGKAYDLHHAALRWLECQGFFNASGVGLERGSVFLEPTKEAKLARIATLNCTHFIDDLPEFLAEPAFPPAVQRILFDPTERQAIPPGVTRGKSWEAIGRLLGC